MSATPPGLSPSPAPSGDAAALADAVARQWAVLHEAAWAIAALANLAPETPSTEIAEFPARARGVTGRRRVMIEEGITDLIAMMEPGLTALLSMHERGGAAKAAAQTLWREFFRARRALLGLCPLPAAGAESEEAERSS